jgi:hypothetical protein
VKHGLVHDRDEGDRHRSALDRLLLKVDPGRDAFLDQFIRRSTSALTCLVPFSTFVTVVRCMFIATPNCSWLRYPAAIRASLSFLPSRRAGWSSSLAGDTIVATSGHEVAIRGHILDAHTVALPLHVRLTPATDLTGVAATGRAAFKEGKGNERQ